MKKILLLSMALTFSSYVYSRCDLDFIPFTNLNGERSISELSQFKLGSYNVLNLEVSPGKYKYNKVTGAREFVAQKITKDIDQVKGVAKVIKNENLDIVVLQEVEGKLAVNLFNKKYLDDAYEVFVLPGNDTRGIDIGYLVKKDLPFKIKINSHRDQKWTSTTTNKEENIFSRDLPGLNIWSKNSDAQNSPDFVILGNHLKSQRDRSQDPKSRILRARQAAEIRNITTEYQIDHPGIPVYIAGDFNADIPSGNEFSILFKDKFLQDSFSLTSPPQSKAQRVTHTFHPRQGDTSYSQLDAILVNDEAAKTLKNSKVYRYKNADGSEKDIPATYKQREMNPSDHFPIIVELDLTRILN